MAPSRKAISIYSGAGGIDLGFEAAGFSIAVALDTDAAAVATLRNNRTRPVIHGDIHDISSREILATARLDAGEADALIGGPPCQPFSKAAYWHDGDTRRLRDPRAATLAAYFRVLRETLPKTFLLENVPGIAYRGKSEGMELIQRKLRQINRSCNVNYSCCAALLNAAGYGVPQTRERLVIVGSRDGARFRFPEPTHGKPPLEPYRTAWDAIGDLEKIVAEELKPTGKWAGLLPSIPEGDNYRVHTARGPGLPLFAFHRPYWGFLLKLAKNRPSWTIPAHPGPATGPFHWKNRRLSKRELCRLQTFPDDYEVCGNPTAIQRQLGNAMPAALAEILARKIRRDLLHDRISLQAVLIPDQRLPVPPPETAAWAPVRYASMSRQR